MRVGTHNRMSTSKLCIDPSRVAAAEKDDWAKFVFRSLLPWIGVSFVGRSFFYLFIYQRVCQDREPLFRQRSLHAGWPITRFTRDREDVRAPLASCVRYPVRLSDTQPPYSYHSRARTVRRRMSGTHKRLRVAIIPF